MMYCFLFARMLSLALLLRKAGKPKKKLLEPLSLLALCVSVRACARVCVCVPERDGANKLSSAGEMQQTSRYMYMVSYHHSGTQDMAVKSNGRGCSPQNAGQTLHESDS